MKILPAVVALLAIIAVATASPTNAPTKACFPNNADLKTAVTFYIIEGCSTNSSCAIGKTWGMPIGTWCTSKVTDMSSLFSFTKFNDNISGWDVSKVTKMDSMFYGASAFNQDISGWDVGSVKSITGMFASSAFNQNISGWNLGSVTSMMGMFYKASAFNQDISGWNVGNVTAMGIMFNAASAFNQDISGWNVSKVTDMAGMFQFASAFNQNLCPWKNKIPIIKNTDIFTSSGCTYQTTPTSEPPNKTYCAVNTCPIPVTYYVSDIS